jgi:hypothetical protein
MPKLAEALEAALDEREYPRVPVVLSADLIIPANTRTWPARVINLSAGGAGLEFASRPPAPELVGTLAIEGFGNFDGITIRRQGNVAGLRFLIGEAERHHLTRCLTAFMKGGLRAVREDTGPTDASVLPLTRQNGRPHLCGVEDISLHGVALSTDIAVPKGEHVLIGRMFGRVVDASQGQVVVEFLRRRAA